MIPSDFALLAQPHAITGESPLWDHGRGCLWWIDIQAQRLLRTTMNGTTSATPMPWQPGFVALGESGHLVIGLENGLWTHCPETGVMTHVADVESERPTVRLNDGKPDSKGRLWFGSMDMTGTGQAIGRLYCREIDGTIRVIREAVTIPNAIAPFADGSALWFTDTPTGVLEQLSIDGDEVKATNVMRFPDDMHPDGACVAADGTLFVAIIGPGEVWQIDESGAVIATLKLPVSRPTMPMLGGPDGSHLFVTNQRRFLTPDELNTQTGAGGIYVKAGIASAGPVGRVKGL